MKRIGKSLAALALALVMSLTLLPVQAMAAEVGTETASDGALLDGYLYQLAWTSPTMKGASTRPAHRPCTPHPGT